MILTIHQDNSKSMATTNLSLPHFSLLPSHHRHTRPNFSTLQNRARPGPTIRASNEDRLGDFGARDPFPAEIASDFGNKVLGFGNTEHKILIPTVTASSLAQQPCTPLDTAMLRDDAHQLLRKVVGWRLVEGDDGMKLQCLWKLRDYECGVELINRIYKVVKVAGHFPSLHLEQPNQVRAELWTSALGGLSMNDFIVAAKIDAIATSDLVPRRRAWA